MSQRVGIVYAITCPDGFSYIGKTVQELGARVSQHKSPQSACRAIRDAYQKHGNKMTVQILLRCSEKDLDLNESFYIEKLDTVHPRGYNLRCGNMAAMPTTANALSTFVHPPAEYESVQDEQDVHAAVEVAVQDVLGTDFKPWAGVVQMSVSDLNAIRGATQHVPWAGPVKGVPINGGGDKMPGFLQEAFAHATSRLVEHGVLRVTNMETAARQEQLNMEQMRRAVDAWDIVQDLESKKRKRDDDEVDTKRKNKLANTINAMIKIGQHAKAEELTEQLMKLD